MDILFAVAGFIVFVCLLGIIVGRYLARNTEEICSEDIEKYFIQQDQDRSFPNHNMNGGSEDE